MPVERRIKVLTLASGNCPFEDWFTSLKDSPTRLRIAARIARIQGGNLGDCKNVGEGVSELRMDFGPGYRLYFAQVGPAIVVLLAGGDKSTQDSNIRAAQALWEEHKDATERFQRDFGE